MKSVHNKLKQMEEDNIRDIMKQLSLSREEAVAWREQFTNKIHRDREVVYNFLKKYNPRVQEMEKEEQYQKRFVRVADEMHVSLETARAHVITGDILAEGGMKILRKGKPKSDPADFQEMLGVTVQIPQDVLDALGD
jgi:hypothetical protein